MKVLVLAAHPDDEVLGVGPLILQLIANGHRVDVMCFTENSTRHGKEPAASVEAFYDSCAQLGVTKSWQHGYPDQSLDRMDFTQLVSLVEKVNQQQEYDVVLAHSEFDLNRDHRIVSEVARVACRGQVKMLAEYQVVSSSEHQYGGAFVPNLIVPVEYEHMSKAWTTFADCYHDEVCLAPHPRSLLGFRAQLSHAGMLIRKEHAVPLRIVLISEMPGKFW